jgi:hypothetical protein
MSAILIRSVALAVVGTAIMSPAVYAQRGFGGRAGLGVSRSAGFEYYGGRRHYAGATYLPWFYPDYYDYGPDIVEGPPPQTIVLQTPQPASQAVAPPAPVEPLVIELRGDRWVRITGYGEPQAGGELIGPEQMVAARNAQPSLPPAVLVFRDGHQEEIGKYVIIGSTIYARADYWRSGSWTRKVEIAELDVPTTLKVNQQRGAQFRLPSSPNEVMMRP